MAEQLAPVVGRRHIAGEGQNILCTPFLPRDLYPLIPLNGLRLVVFEFGGVDAAGVGGAEVRQVAIYRAAFGGAIDGDGFAERFAQAQNLGSEPPLPRRILLQADTEKLAIVFEGPLRGDVERAIGPAGMQADYATRADGMADAEFVENVRVEDRYVSEDEVGGD